MALEALKGGFSIRNDDQKLLFEQRAITYAVNENFVQVGAVYLKPSGKTPYENDWFNKGYRDTRLQSWIDDPEHHLLNVGYNLQFGWVDVDVDSADPDFNRSIVAALDHLRVDTRFQFGRASVGAPSHVLVQLNNTESDNFNQLKQFEPNEFRLKGNRYKVELRSLATSTVKANVAREAKQTVMPGSVYPNKKDAGDYDISVWYHNGNAVAHSIADVAVTTPHKTEFNALIRAIAFGTVLYLVKPHWIEGSRQLVASKIAGWLARVVQDSNGLNNHEAIADDVFCPIDSDGIAESLIEFICKELGDEEPYMRVRTYHDACSKLTRNPDAKIPGWPSMAQLFGDEVVNALRTVLMPGADVSILTKLAERYLYDETDDLYIDRERFRSFGTFAHSGNELDRRHRGDFVRVGGKLKPAFKLFEVSTIRKRVNTRDLYPDLPPGGVFRIDRIGERIGDDDEDESNNVAFNTWQGWPISIAAPVDVDTLGVCNSYLDRLFGYLTRDNEEQALWLKQWIAWTIQNPGQKQQVAPVIVGGQGVGKSFFGNTFLRMLLQSLWGTASPKLLEGAFSIEPFIGKMIVFIDEAKFHSEASTEEIKKLIRNVNIGGAEKFQSARNYRIFSRIVFASNHFEMNLGQSNVQDRALFYIKAYDRDHLKMTPGEFRAWTVTLKPYFDEYQQLLNRRTVREHYMHIFANLPVDRHKLEDTTLSSSADQDIVANNMSWARRIAKYIIEDARVLEDSDISMPFTMSDLNKKVVEVCKELGMMPVQGARVLNEFKDAGVIESYSEQGRNMIRFRYKAATLTSVFGEAIAVPMEPRFQYGPDDEGLNETTLASPKGYRGLNNRLFGRI